MKKKLFVVALLFLVAETNYAQISWDRTFGGIDDEFLYTLQATTDGGCIVGGSTQSGISGDKTQASRGGYDFWVVKTDVNGHKDWDKRFGSGGQEGLEMIQQTSDGGYILGGLAGGGTGGDKTEAGRGSDDYWVVKIDAAGNKEWDKTLGGTGTDELRGLKQTKDGGYVFGGYSNSGIGGDKTENSWGGNNFRYDYWVVKTDSSGNKQWDKRFGGTNDDMLMSLDVTSDGGYILGGWSSSDSSGDKTQPCWGSNDYWIVKIDSLGNKEWDKRFGTISDDQLYTVLQMPNGGYILFGGGGIGINGDKTIQKGGFWVIKTDALGNMVGENVYAGQAAPVYMETTNDGGYLMSGDAHYIAIMDTTWDKTEPNLGSPNTWVVKIDSVGAIKWDYTIGTWGGDFNGHAVQTTDRCYAVANASNAGAGGYKSQAAWDSSYDYFVVKFCMGDEVGIDDRPQTIDHNGIQIQVWPNPFASDLSIALKSENIHEASFTITNAMGQLIYKREESNLAAGYTKVLDLRYLPNGIYFVEVGTKDGCSVRQVVKE